MGEKSLLTINSAYNKLRRYLLELNYKRGWIGFVVDEPLCSVFPEYGYGHYVKKNPT